VSRDRLRRLGKVGVSADHVRIRLPTSGNMDAGIVDCENRPLHEVVAQDGFAAVAAIHDVIDGIGVLDAQLASHDGTLPGRSGRVNSKNMRMCGTDPVQGTDPVPTPPRRITSPGGEGMHPNQNRNDRHERHHGCRPPRPEKTKTAFKKSWLREILFPP